MLPEVIYFSSVSGNTARFVEKLQAALPELGARRLPLRRTDPPVDAERPYVLVTPTYAAGYDPAAEVLPDAVPKQVIRFLNDPANRGLLLGTVSCGNTNFGRAYCIAGDIIARKTGTPHLGRVELFGTPEETEHVAGVLASLAE